LATEPTDEKSKKAATRARVRPVDAKTEASRAKALANKAAEEFFGLGDPDAPKRVGIHGESGSGKTTFLAGVPNIAILPIEQGVNQDPTTPRWKGRLDTYDDFWGALTFLRHGKHPYKAVGIEQAMALEQLLVTRLEDRLDEVNGGTLATLNENEHGAGYDLVRDEWQIVLMYLDDIRKNRGMDILLTFPTRATRVPSIDHTPEFFRHEPHFSVSTKARALLKGWLDYLLFFKVGVTAAKSTVTKKMVGNVGQHMMHFTQKGAHDAKCRGLVQWPESMPLTIETGWSSFNRLATVIAKHGKDLPSYLANAAAEAVLHLPDKKGPPVISGEIRRMEAMRIVFQAIEACDWPTVLEVIEVANEETAALPPAAKPAAPASAMSNPNGEATAPAAAATA
jgi:hypothetical protein